MSDLAFHEITIPRAGLRSRLLAPPRRLLRKLLLPYFARQVEILEALRAASVAAEHDRARLHEAVRGLRGRVDRLEGRLVEIESQVGSLRARVEQAEGALAPALGACDAVRARQDELGRAVEGVIALNWDHVALARRLARIEDRLAGLDEPMDRTEADDEPPALPFPGLDTRDAAAS